MDLTVLKFIPIKGDVRCLVEIDDLVYVGTDRSHVMVYDRKWNVSSTLISIKGVMVNNAIKFNGNVYLFTNVLESIDGDIIELSTNASRYNINDSILHNDTLYTVTIDRLSIMDINTKNITSIMLYTLHGHSKLFIMNEKVCYIDENGVLISYDKYGNMSSDTNKLFNKYNACPLVINHKDYLYIAISGDYHFDNNGQIIIYKDMVKLNSVKLKNSIHSMIIHNNHVICGHKSGFLSIWKEDECLMYRKVHSYDINVMLSFNDQLWLGMDRLVLVLGEYHKHHYSGLPQMQLDKLMEWEEAARTIPIHKDIKLLFIRELLQ